MSKQSRLNKEKAAKAKESQDKSPATPQKEGGQRGNSQGNASHSGGMTEKEKHTRS